jgi:hypothetical protein
MAVSISKLALVACQPFASAPQYHGGTTVDQGRSRKNALDRRSMKKAKK